MTAITLCALAALGTGCAGRSIGDEREPTGDTSVDTRDITSLTTVESAPQTDDDTPTTEPHDSLDPSQTTVPPSPDMTAEEACQKLPQGSRATPTEEAFRELLIGSWLLCDSASVFGTTEEVGLVIHADFTWQKLLRTDDGELVASSAWEQSGSWESLDTSDMNGPGIFQLNMSIDGSGTIYTHPVFAIEPDVMRLNNNGVFVADYAKF